MVFGIHGRKSYIYLLEYAFDDLYVCLLRKHLLNVESICAMSQDTTSESHPASLGC